MFTVPEKGIGTRQIQGILTHFFLYFLKPWSKYTTYSKFK